MPTKQLHFISLTQKLLLTISCLLMNACSWQQTKQAEILNAHHNFYDNYEINLQDFNREISRSLALRKRSVDFFTQELLEAENQFFDAKDINRIQTTVIEYKQHRDVLLNDIAYQYRKIIDNVELKLSLSRRTELIVIPAELGRKGGDILYINPTDTEGKKYISVLKLGLAATLTLYDNFIIAIMPYQENGHFRRKINYDNIDNRKIIETISGDFRRLDNYKDTFRAVEFYEEIYSWERENAHRKSSLSKDNDYFNTLINGSYTNRRIKEITLLDRLNFRTVRFRRIIRDILFDKSNHLMSSVSQLFGNSIGILSSRKGYLKNISKKHKNKIESDLIAGDILLEKTPFRLTDRFIPGHWGHVAIWVGSEKELKELGVWEKLPELYAKAQNRLNYKGASFQQQIRSGHKIVEALRAGVQINSLEHFLNIDDMAVLREKKSNKTLMKRYIVKAFEQIGKDYDFNFDVETDTKIVCSELAFIVYDNYKWPVSKTAGRFTISPDHIGKKANGNGPFTPVMLYHDGKQIEKNIQANFNHLLKTEYSKVVADLQNIQ